MTSSYEPHLEESLQHISAYWAFVFLGGPEDQCEHYTKISALSLVRIPGKLDFWALRNFPWAQKCAPPWQKHCKCWGWLGLQACPWFVERSKISPMEESTSRNGRLDNSDWLSCWEQLAKTNNKNPLEGSKQLLQHTEVCYRKCFSEETVVQ